MNGMGKLFQRLVFVIIVSLLLACFAAAQEVSVAAAADLQFAMQELAAQFQHDTGIRVNATYGSSGNFTQQIQNGAPFDMFFSANLEYPKQLDAAGLIVPGSLYQYARGKIVLWVPNNSKLDIGSGLKSLLDPSVQKLAIANPEHAPYGKAAVSALQQEKLYDAVKPRLVLGENIAQTATFVVSGAADAGIIALSLALSPNMKDKGRYFEIPASDYPPINQACVILKSSKNQAEDGRFLDFLKTADAAKILSRFGFGVASSAP
jgi:molybdate transport system substrate-binding protein